jgi:hypothetical protein
MLFTDNLKMEKEKMAFLTHMCKYKVKRREREVDEFFY